MEFGARAVFEPLSELEDQLFKLSCLEFDSYEDLEDWMEKNFGSISGAELNAEEQVGFLVCNHRILLVFKLVGGKWKFSRAEITGYALVWDEESI